MPNKIKKITNNLVNFFKFLETYQKTIREYLEAGGLSKFYAFGTKKVVEKVKK